MLDTVKKEKIEETIEAGAERINKLLKEAESLKESMKEELEEEAKKD